MLRRSLLIVLLAVLASSLVSASSADPSSTVSIGDASATEGDGGTVTAFFTVALNAESSDAVSVDFATTDGSASTPADYAAASGTVTLDPGETSKTVDVVVKGDTMDEADETFDVNLSNPVSATITDPQATGTILDNDPPPTLSVDDISIDEGDTGTTDATFTVALSAASGRSVTVDYATSPGTATSDTDFTPTSGSVTFAAGQTERPITVPVVGDLVDEADETFFVDLSGPTNAGVPDGHAVGTIRDDDDSPSLAVGDVTVAEGNSGTVDASFTVSLSAASSHTVTVDYATGAGTAASGTDYAAKSGSLSLAPGETVKPVAVRVQGDTLDESNETFFLNLSNPSNASLSDAQGLGTIIDDDPLPQVAIDDVTVAEGDTGTVTASFGVTLTPASGRAVSVQYATVDATARAPADYTAQSGVLVIPSGETTEQVTVPVESDTLDEDDETFGVTLSDPVDATIGDVTAVGTIADNDPPPLISIGDAAVTEGDSGTTNATFTVTLSAQSGRTVTVDYATADGTASAPSDYTPSIASVSFAPGQTTRTITVPVKGDVLDEGAETYRVNLSNAPNAAIADAQGIGTIIDDDDVPTISIGDVTVPEGNSSANANFTVTLSAPSSQQVTVGYSTADGTAVAPGDYTTTGGNVSFAPGQTSRTIRVVVKGDTVDENDEETFFVNLSDAVNATVADGDATGTIVDDDPSSALAVNDFSLTEGNAGTSNATFTITLSPASGRDASVNWTTSNGTASAPSDYTSSSGNVTFTVGQTTKTVNVPVNGDTTFEGDETFTVNLSGAVEATIADAQGLGTILNDDVTPPPPPPPPPASPPSPRPTPVDRTPPREVSNLKLLAGDGKVTISWKNPADADFQRVSIIRITSTKSVRRQAVYEGRSTAFIDRAVKNGTTYRYRIRTADRSGNVSTGVERAVTPLPKLYGPLRSAVVTDPPTLKWLAAKEATYYNVQLWRVGGGGQAAALRPTKILSVWPGKPRYKLSRTWRFEGRRYSLTPGRYTWYVWPGVGKRSANKYKALIGQSSFTVKAKTARKDTKKARRR